MVLNDGRTVACIACGAEVPREDAREYDKEGERWDRRGKSFEYLCKPCYQELSKADREDLESRLVAAGAGTQTREEFLARYFETVDERNSPQE
ncbi:MAG: hypothetical protein ABEJ57_04115 [Halobacteriaceae archaeon]